MGKKSTLTAEQRSQLVLRLLSKEEPAAQIARRAGVSEQTLYRWREEFIGAGNLAMNGRGARRELACRGGDAEHGEGPTVAVVDDVTHLGADQGVVPYAMQDAVRSCWLSFTVATISGCGTSCAFKAQRS